MTRSLCACLDAGPMCVGVPNNLDRSLTALSSSRDRLQLQWRSCRSLTPASFCVCLDAGRDQGGGGRTTLIGLVFFAGCCRCAGGPLHPNETVTSSRGSTGLFRSKVAGGASFESSWPTCPPHPPSQQSCHDNFEACRRISKCV